ncbi:MAG: LTA synthase family protein [Prevotella sp.]
MKIRTPFIHTVIHLLGAHLCGLAGMSLFRIVEYFTLRDMASGDGTSAVQAFLRGLWFDNVVGCYILVAPLVIVLAAACAGNYHRYWRRGTAVWMSVFYTLVFAVSAANIPYFRYFFKNINSSIFEWFGYTGTTAGMVTGERSYLIFILLFLVMAAAFACLQWWLARRSDRAVAAARKVSPRRKPLMVACETLSALLLVGLCIFGIRGRVGYNPIKVSQAYYCNDPFLNQLGIAPAFNLLTSVLDDMRKENAELHLLPPHEAIAYARGQLAVTGANDSVHVLRRHIAATRDLRKCNVVMVLMESMSASLLQTFGQKAPLTPVLDSLCRHSLTFTRCYSAGIHTNHGLTASLYSFPAMMKRNLMKGTVTPRRSGIPTVLKAQGYRNLFFMTHEAQYDNMNAFLRTNGYDEVYAQEDYPAEAVVNSFGVSDSFLFTYALQAINRTAASGKPFFATLLTVSNHPPYVIPADCPTHSTDDEQRIVEYADKAIGDFLASARREPWYDNTLFVFVADHGKIVGQPDCELPQSYNHIPLIIFGPGVEPSVQDGLAMQVDIMPTLLGLLGVSYDYDGFGIDLLSGRRDMVFYSADDQLVARDSVSCYINYPSSGRELCYDALPDGSLRESADTARFSRLRRFVFSMIQTAEYEYRRN